MKNKTLLTQWLPILLQQRSGFFWRQFQVQLNFWRTQLAHWLYAYWFRLIFFGLAVFIALQKEVSIQLTWHNPAIIQQNSPDLKNKETQLGTWVSQSRTEKKKRPLTEMQKRQLTYVQRFGKVAQEEMKKYGIPASITLAQGLLETNAGKSPLATKNNNHFGLKCFSKKCGKGHCSNFSDDSHKDFFRKYNTAWESFRAHSKLLQSKRYRPLYNFDKNDYKAWANGLKKAGYATDKQYAQKLIKLIEELELYQWDS